MSEANAVPGWVNSLVKALLRSPLHAVVSRNIMLLSFTGRKTGANYTVPVSYVRDGDLVTLFTDRAWAKNLRDGRGASMLIRGKTLTGSAELLTGPQIAAPLADFLRRIPRDAKYHAVRREPGGGFRQADIDRAAAAECMVRIRLAPQQAVQ